MKPIKWVKFYYTGTGEVKTLHVENGHFQDDGQTHMFSNKEDMLSKSTEETANFWDNNFVGVGQVK